MSLSGTYGESDDNAAIPFLERAVELGVDFLDSSDAYGLGQNEELIGRALASLSQGRRDNIVLATKFGQDRRSGGVNGRPEYVQQACEASLKRLGVDVIDLYYQHRVDPNVPVEDTVGAMSRLVEQGKVRFLGLCEARPERIQRVEAIAADKECTVAQLSLAWLLAQGPDVVPIPGTKRIERVDENLAALDVRLTQDEIDSIAEAV